jgi:hypothetical protein
MGSINPLAYHRGGCHRKVTFSGKGSSPFSVDIVKLSGLHDQSDAGADPLKNGKEPREGRFPIDAQELATNPVLL